MTTRAGQPRPLESNEQGGFEHRIQHATTRLPAFSMAELMIAVVILGIGLLITSSMFPIAWYKAKDVAEATDLNACSNSAEIMAKQLLQVTGVDPNGFPTSFVPGDWIHANTSDSNYPVPVIYPDTRVHHLNLGNLLVKTTDINRRIDVEPDPFNSSKKIPVADNTWTLDDTLAAALKNDAIFRNDFASAGLHYSKVTAQARLFPPLPGKTPVLPASANNIPVAFAQWSAKFESRRYCWSVFYRFEEMPGTATVTEEALQIALDRPRLLTMYYFMLKRPVSARYARQSGIQTSASYDWPETTRPKNPRALGPSLDVRLPVPWLIEANLTTSPQAGVSASGVPSEIKSSDTAVVGMLQTHSVLLDDRTGSLCRIVSIRPGEDGNVIYSLDREYTFDDLFFDQREPLDANDDGDWKTMVDDNWKLYWEIATGAGAGGDGVWSSKEKTEFNKAEHAEEDPLRRFYWVFPPPVDGSRTGNVPLFDGTQPVVGVEVRQMVIEP